MGVNGGPALVGLDVELEVFERLEDRRGQECSRVRATLLDPFFTLHLYSCDADGGPALVGLDVELDALVEVFERLEDHRGQECSNA